MVNLKRQEISTIINNKMLSLSSIIKNKYELYKGRFQVKGRRDSGTKQK